MTADHVKQQGLTEAARRFYHEIQTEDRNLALGEGSGYIHHHFGIGQVDWSLYADGPSQEQIREIIHQLEQNQVRRLTTMMGKIRPEHHVLDGGSGRGGTAFYIVNHFGAQVDGVTVAHYQVEFSNRLAREVWLTERARFHEMDMLDLTFPEDSFHHVVTNETTMYIVNLHDLLSGFGRVLKPGGRYTFATWCINEEFEGREDIPQRIHDHYPGTGMHTRKEYLEALRETDFQIVAAEDLTTEVLPHWEIRNRWEQASGIEQTYLEGHRLGKLLYIMVSSINQKPGK